MRQNPLLAGRMNPGANPTYAQRYQNPLVAGRMNPMAQMARPSVPVMQSATDTMEKTIKGFAQHAELRISSKKMYGNNSVTHAVSGLPYKGKLVYFLRGMVSLDDHSGWKFIKPGEKDTKEEKSSRADESKTSKDLFDPVTHCKIDLQKEEQKLKPRRPRKAYKSKSFEKHEREEHGKIDFEALKSFVKKEAEKFDLEHDHDVNKILSFALQDYMKSLLKKLFISCQVRRNLPLRDAQLKGLVQKSTIPEKFLEDVQKRDELQQRSHRKYEELIILKSEENAIEDARLKCSSDRAKLSNLKTDISRGTQVIRNDIQQARALIYEDQERRAAESLGLGSTSLNVSHVQKKRKLNDSDQREAPILPQMVDVIAFLSKDARFRKSDLMQKYYLNLGRARARKIDLKHVFNR